MWFQHIPDARVLIRTKQGVFLQKDVFKGPHNRLFFQHGGGFVRIGAHDATSAPALSVVAFDLPFTPAFGAPIKTPHFTAGTSPYCTEVPQ